jgi:thymidylate synthase ThyX
MTQILSPMPTIKLQKYFSNSYDHAVAAARTCYNPKVMSEKEVTEGHRERIGKGCFEGGHHTVFQHAHFSFKMENISRHVVWAFLHSHTFYNSEQSSQRYVKLNEIKATIPPIEGEALKIYSTAIVRSWEVYRQLSEILLEDIIDIEKKTFPNKVVDEKERRKLDKKAIELARYVVPVAAHTSMVHTLSGITIYRLHKTMNQLPCPWEARVIVNKMIDEVKKVDANFFKDLKDPWPLEETQEFKAMKYLVEIGDSYDHTEDFIKEFDEELEGKRVKLVSYLQDSEKIMADSIRAVLGATKSRLNDEDAIALVLDPKKNLYLTDTLNISSHSPLMRSMMHPYFVFKKKISHTADSQNQRHRMAPATRPVLIFQDTETPDYITPVVIQRNPKAKKIYDDFMIEIWDYKNKLLELGVSKEYAQYLLPNSVSIRLVESGNLANLWHKWRMRLCNTAQREIWECSIQEVEQVGEVFPLLAKHVGPDCKLRYNADPKIKPFCTEGPRWCGFPVWIWDKIEENKRPI